MAYWRYFIDGEMLANTYTPDGYYVDEEGKRSEAPVTE